MTIWLQDRDMIRIKLREEGVPAKATVNVAHPPSAIKALLSLSFPTDVSNSTGQGIIKMAEASQGSFYFFFSRQLAIFFVPVSQASLVGQSGVRRGREAPPVLHLKKENQEK